MAKRSQESADFDWAEEEGDEPVAAEAPAPAPPTGAKAGFHLAAARRIEEARERLQLRKAIEDFDDYDI